MKTTKLVIQSVFIWTAVKKYEIFHNAKQPQQHSSTCVEGGHSLGFPIVRGLIMGLQISPVDFKKLLKINRSTDFGQN
jgi:hypothetical protein